MLTLDQCLKANRPLLFTVAESDIELLGYLRDNYKETEFKVYSSTTSALIDLNSLLKGDPDPEPPMVVKGKATPLNVLFRQILETKFDSSNVCFIKYIFLDCQTYMNTAQNVRYVKDILSRYQLDPHFAVNLIFVSQYVNVPMGLERLSEVAFFDVPEETQLKEQSDFLSEKLGLKEKPSEEVIINLRGMTKFEVEQAYLQSYQLFKKIDLDFIRNFKKSSIAKTDLLSLMETDMTFDDIGGLDRLKKWIKKSYGGWTVEGKKFGLPLLKGILLVGIPGTGKSLTAKVLGKVWGLPAIKFEMSKLFSSRIGESENNMHRILKLFETVSPVVVFIDELEKSMAGIESSTFSDAGTTARTMAAFLSWMQDTTKPVFVVATANAVSYVPPELISRFDKVFFVNLPQKEERKEIFKIHLKKIKRDPALFDLERLAEKSKDLSGREIEQAIKEALYNAYHDKKEITTDNILEVLNSKPGIMLTMKEKVGALLKWVGWDDQRHNGIRADYASLPDNIDSIQAEIEKMINEVSSDDKA